MSVSTPQAEEFQACSYDADPHVWWSKSWPLHVDRAMQWCCNVDCDMRWCCNVDRDMQWCCNGDRDMQWCGNVDHNMQWCGNVDHDVITWSRWRWHTIHCNADCDVWWWCNHSNHYTWCSNADQLWWCSNADCSMWRHSTYHLLSVRIVHVGFLFSAWHPPPPPPPHQIKKAYGKELKKHSSYFWCTWESLHPHTKTDEMKLFIIRYATLWRQWFLNSMSKSPHLAWKFSKVFIHNTAIKQCDHCMRCFHFYNSGQLVYPHKHF